MPAIEPDQSLALAGRAELAGMNLDDLVGGVFSGPVEGFLNGIAWKDMIGSFLENDGGLGLKAKQKKRPE